MTQPKPVLCLGEALIDVVIRDDTRSEHVGGSPLNVACVITSLGRPALIGAWWGRDDHGKLIEDYAADHGVGIVPGSDGAAKTSLAYARLNDAGSAEYEFDLSWEVPPLPAPEAIAHLHTGSLAATLEPGGTQVLEAARALSPTTPTLVQRSWSPPTSRAGASRSSLRWPMLSRSPTRTSSGSTARAPPSRRSCGSG